LFTKTPSQGVSHSKDMNPGAAIAHDAVMVDLAAGKAARPLQPAPSTVSRADADSMRFTVAS
jgi:hypothetical protein